MWYLIVPPIIVVASLAFLLWYLSRKSADPIIAEKVSHLEQSGSSVSFSRTKTFILRVIEKVMQRFKVVSLQMHNILHERLQSVRERRQKIDEAVAAQHAEEEIAVPEATYASEHAGEEAVPVRPENPEKEADAFAIPIIRRKRRFGREETSRAERPMVSATAAQPETEEKRSVRDDVSHEEALIGSIAVNPKDFAAYEALGDYYLERGDAKDAKECYRQVLRLSPTHRMVKIKIRRLEKLLTQKPE